MKKITLSQKVIYQFLLLSFDFGKEQKDIPYWQRAMCYLFDEVILEITYSDLEYSQLKSQRIYNREALKKEWNKLKTTLIKDNKGIVIQNYFNQIDALFEKQNKLLDFVYQSSMYGAFLNAKENEQSIFYQDNSLKETFFIEDNLKYEVLIKKKQ